MLISFIQMIARGAGRCLLIVLLLFTVPVEVIAVDPVGRIIMSTGRVMATSAEGFERTLSRNDVVFPGDLIRTGPRGRAQVRFEDDALVDLKPDTEFEIEEYRPRAADRGGSAVFNFLSGAFRTITGFIGIGEDDEYRMNTTVVTVGIRGTEYSLQRCDEACVALGNKPGIYGRVTVDSITASNEFGFKVFEAGQYFFTPLEGPPVLLLVPPVGILDGGEDGRTGSPPGEEGEVLAEAVQGRESSALGDTDETVAPAIGTANRELLTAGTDDFESADTGVDANTVESLFTTGSQTWLAAGLSGSVSSGSSFLGASKLVGPLLENELNNDPDTTLSRQQFVLNANGALTDIRFEFSDGSSEAFDFAGTTVQQSGSDFGVDWGLLTGPWQRTLDDGAGTANTISTDGGGVAFAFTDSLTTPAQLSEITGSLAYSVAAGPDAVDAFGNLWAVNQLDIAVDFTNGLADLTGFDLTDGNDTIVTSGAQPLILDPSLGALYIDPASPVPGSWSGTSGSGAADVVLAGFFVGPDGTILNVSFTADQLDGNGIPINSIGGLKLLAGQ